MQPTDAVQPATLRPAAPSGQQHSKCREARVRQLRTLKRAVADDAAPHVKAGQPCTPATAAQPQPFWCSAGCGARLLSTTHPAR